MEDAGGRLSSASGLHPQYLGANFVWWRTTGRTVLTFVTHEVQDLFGDEDNPVRRVLVGGETMRRRVDIADHELDFPVLHDLKAEGATDYFALPIKSSFGTNYMATYVTDRLGGFTASEISDLTRVSHRLGLLADLRNHRRIASSILDAYLGSKTGPKVLAGQIRRGTGEEMTLHAPMVISCSRSDVINFVALRHPMICLRQSARRQ
jgi:adenylate cyclase